MVLKHERSSWFCERALEVVEHQFPVEMHGDEPFFEFDLKVVPLAAERRAMKLSNATVSVLQFVMRGPFSARSDGF